MIKFIKIREVVGEGARARLREKTINVASIVEIAENEGIRETRAQSPAMADLDSRIRFSTIHLNVGMHGSTVIAVGTAESLLSECVEV